jgi:nitronate monooxygenase
VIAGIRVPIVQAPLAGGPSTPELAAAVAGAGGLGFLAAGYRAPDDVRGDLARVRALTDGPVGVNLFAPGAGPADPADVRRFAEAIRPAAETAGVELGAPRHDDDAFGAKLDVVREARPPVVSFTFGCPPPELVAELRGLGSAVWVTVTDVDEAREAAAAGADALVVQGAEAGGHRGSFVDRPDAVDRAVLPLLQLVRAAVDPPLVAAGGIATGRGVAAVLAAGAVAAQVGTAFMRCPEAGTSDVHRAALASPRATRLTRAFTGRRARGIANRFLVEHGDAAPIAYPELHHLTAPLRAHGRRSGDPEVVNLWAGEAHELAEEVPAAELVARLAADARSALAEAAARLD